MSKKQDLVQFCRKICYDFSQLDLLKQALTHRSAGFPNNERLEFLGDAALNFSMAEILFSHFKDHNEGKLSRLRANLVKGDCLAEIALELNLGDILILGTGEARSGGHRRASILADTLEAVLGAIYLEAGFTTVKDVIAKLYAKKLQDPNLSTKLVDYKSFLQEQLQAKKLPLPHYELTKVTGDLHNQCFFINCTVKITEFIAEAHGKTRRKAEQEAAKVMIAYLDLRKHRANP
ncbi:MAG: ribonuclease III [Legionellales bacterium RIFCSPHIGHO2_12_FULL_37_14]|nr:MAG: ribonuclease III [Legionellales bacterium RIFCSPHIGHO2_12_FULL_37_14]